MDSTVFVIIIFAGVVVASETVIYSFLCVSISMGLFIAKHLLECDSIVLNKIPLQWKIARCHKGRDINRIVRHSWKIEADGKRKESWNFPYPFRTSSIRACFYYCSAYAKLIIPKTLSCLSLPLVTLYWYFCYSIYHLFYLFSQANSPLLNRQNTFLSSNGGSISRNQNCCSHKSTHIV